MAPQSVDAKLPEEEAKSIKTEPVKNTFFQHVEHAEIDRPDLKAVFPKSTYPPIPELAYDERAKYADPTFKNLLEHASIAHLQPHIGSVISGLQLHELTPAQKDELALLMSVRGVVFFNDQELTVDQQLEFFRYYGSLHIHQFVGHPEGKSEVVVLRSTVETFEKYKAYARGAGSGNSGWHSDISYERQPPSYTALKLHAAPAVGADTTWASSSEAFDRLTPAFQKFLEGLTAVHSGKAQAEGALSQGLPVRRPWVEFEHPVVRTHPVTKRKLLYVNPQFTKRIVGLSLAESNAVLNFLYAHIAQGHEFQVRYHLNTNTVAVWDNRSTMHLAPFSFDPVNRLGTRVTVQGEIPFFNATP